MIIPFEHLSQDALHGLIEAFILRDGTDYGLQEMAFADKCQQVLQQVKAKHILIVFDPATETTNIMSREQYQQQNPPS